MGKPSPKDQLFQFVNANPLSESGRRRNRAIVRTNASNFSWRKLRQTSTTFDLRNATQKRLRLTRTFNHSLAQAVPALESDDSGDQPNGFDDTDIDDDIVYGGVHASSSQKSTVITKFREHRSTRSSIPLNVFRNNDVDPFGTYPSELSIGVIGPLLVQVIQFLSQALPHPSGSVQSLAAESWFQTCISQRGLFHAMVFGQLTRNRSRDPVPNTFHSPERLFCHSEAVRAINRRMSDSSTACDDENILAVLVLAFNGSVLTEKPRKWPYQGPLNKMQVLNVYGGALDPVPLHMDGLKQMLIIRGGLRDVKQPGLAQLLSYGSIIAASRKLAKPLLPFVSMNPDIPDKLKAVRNHNTALSRIGSGFIVLHRVLPIDLVTRIYPVLLHLCDYTMAVHNYVEGTPQAQSVSILADERNFVQHSLMCLESHGAMLESHREHPLYELCRLAAMVYSLTVLFPLPSTTAPFRALGTQMRELMSNKVVHVRWKESSHLMLWVTVMAATASIASNDRSWFVCILDRLINRFSIRSWPEMKESLQEYLWFDGTNDVDGIKLWKEIERSSPFKA